ncbi:MAG: hypothetical protein ACLSUH_13670 [Ruminococcus sp.]
MQIAGMLFQTGSSNIII